LECFFRLISTTATTQFLSSPSSSTPVIPERRRWFNLEDCTRRKKVNDYKSLIHPAFSSFVVPATGMAVNNVSVPIFPHCGYHIDMISESQINLEDQERLLRESEHAAADWQRRDP
jgi:hypothetical protein